MLLAGAHETGLLAALDAAFQAQEAPGPRRLAHTQAATRRMLLQTLLFLGAVGLQRTWDLRSYTGGGLALLSGRPRAYGYRATERFLSELARGGGADALTAALAAWTAALWPSAATDARSGGDALAPFYLDGHRKAVYSDVLLPRGLVARRGAVLGCRALLLLHDAAGHPLLVTTHRGDTHLTVGAPALLARYEQQGGPVRRLIVDREGLAAAFLDQLAGEGRQVITVLRTDQYSGLDSFTDIGPFVPLQLNRHGVLVREVAAARYPLPRPDQPGAPLVLSVALVRDHHWRVPDPARRPPAARAGLAPPTTAKLIPIVTTASAAEPVALARTYFHRWPAQENILKDFLLPLGLDTNHGYAKTPVANSETAKKRAALERRLARLPGLAASAQARAADAAQSHARQASLAQRQAAARYAALYQREAALLARGVPHDACRTLLAAARRAAEAAVARPWARAQRAWTRHRRETATAQGYDQEQERLRRQLADLCAQERPMYELDNAKDQIMTVCHVAVANVAMWVRAHYFPASYAQATWPRLAPFFRLPGRIEWGTQTVQVALCPFNDRALTRDLQVLCERVRSARPHLPDGRLLILTVAEAARPLLYAHQEAVA